jgi:hypothetical protein
MQIFTHSSRPIENIQVLSLGKVFCYCEVNSGKQMENKVVYSIFFLESCEKNQHIEHN